MRTRCLYDGVDQSGGDPVAPGRGVREEVVQITDVRSGRAGVLEEVRDAHELPVDLGAGGVDRVIGGKRVPQAIESRVIPAAGVEVQVTVANE